MINNGEGPEERTGKEMVKLENGIKAGRSIDVRFRSGAVILSSRGRQTTALAAVLVLGGGFGLK